MTVFLATILAAIIVSSVISLNVIAVRAAVRSNKNRRVF